MSISPHELQWTFYIYSVQYGWLLFCDTHHHLSLRDPMIIDGVTRSTGSIEEPHYLSNLQVVSNLDNFEKIESHLCLCII
jgi:hypothetical protein